MPRKAIESGIAWSAWRQKRLQMKLANPVRTVAIAGKSFRNDRAFGRQSVSVVKQVMITRIHPREHGDSAGRANLVWRAMLMEDDAGPGDCINIGSLN